MLLVKKEFFEDIRTGRKTTTLRYWRWPHVRENTLQSVPGLGAIHIRAIRCVEPDQLTDEDARADGFEDLAAMRRALEKLYPPARRKGRKLYQVHFTFVP